MFASEVTDDMLGKSEAAIEVAEDACDWPEEAKTSTIGEKQNI